MTPAELLIALHNLADPELVRSVVQATNLCFKEKSIYTHEVLVLVLSKLLEQPNIPILFMRTVLQSLSIYPAMIRFVINILLRLINKQVSVGLCFGKVEKIVWIWSKHLHLQWKFKLLMGKFTWGNKAKHCWVMSTNFLFSKVCWQCPAMFCLYTSSKLSRQ